MSRFAVVCLLLPVAWCVSPDKGGWGAEHREKADQ